MELTQIIKLNPVLHDGSFNITNGGGRVYGLFGDICIRLYTSNTALMFGQSE